MALVRRFLQSWASPRPLVFTASAALAVTVGCGEDKRASGNEDGVDTLNDGSSGEDDAGGDLLLDAAVGQDDGGDSNPDCTDPGGNSIASYKFSVIWIANSSQNTVSKIDTITATEEARYYSGPPDDRGRFEYLNPSRTSVNLNGDVVVGNRGKFPSDQASFTMITGDRDECRDLNGDGVIQTSTGGTDILAWGEDECIRWNHPVQGFSGRGVAWDAGDPEPCGKTEDPKVWVTYKNWEAGDAPTVRLLNEDGEIATEMANTAGVEEGVVITASGYGNDTFGIYGAAVDGDGNFFGVNQWRGGFVRVDREDFQFEVLGSNGYGMGIDADGNPWGSAGGSLHTIDMSTGEESYFNGVTGSAQRGMAIDRDGYVWVAMNQPNGLQRFDIASGTYTDPLIPLDSADCDEPVGISIDFEGHVWAPCRWTGTAIKFLPGDPGEGGQVVAVVRGLVEPYTYSDMTGGALNLVVNPPVE